MPRKQLSIAGTEGKKIREIDVAAEAYEEARDKRMALTEKETEARENLIAAMKKAKVSVYRDDDAAPPIIVTLVPGVDKVKVTRQEEPEDEGEDAPTPRRRGRSAAAASAQAETD